MTKSAYRFRCLLLVILVGWFGVPTASWAADEPPSPSFVSQPLNEIMILLDSASGAWPDATTVLAALEKNDPSMEARLQGPIAARYLHAIRIWPETLARLPSNSRLRLLQQVLVLTYRDNDFTDQAEKALRADPSVILIERSVTGQFSSVPNDPLLSGPDPQSYQWAPSALNLFAAWDKVRGSAYVADIDNGIQIHGLMANPGMHPDLIANYRPQFSWNFDLNNGTGSAGAETANNGTSGVPGGQPNTATNLDEEPYARRHAC